MSGVFVIAFIVIIGFGSHFFAREDNEVEQIAKEALEETIEGALHLPPDSVEIDFTPEHEEE